MANRIQSGLVYRVITSKYRCTGPIFVRGVGQTYRKLWRQVVSCSEWRFKTRVYYTSNINHIHKIIMIPRPLQTCRFVILPLDLWRDTAESALFFTWSTSIKTIWLLIWIVIHTSDSLNSHSQPSVKRGIQARRDNRVCCVHVLLNHGFRQPRSSWL